MAGLWATIKVNKEKMYVAADRSVCTATDLADYLVRKGLPFRDAHEVTGKVVKYCIESGRKLKDVSLEKYQLFSSIIKKDVYDFITLEASVAARASYGGTAPAQVKRSIQRVRTKWQK
jgi:argininosuccinate lyase